MEVDLEGTSIIFAKALALFETCARSQAMGLKAKSFMQIWQVCGYLGI